MASEEYVTYKDLTLSQERLKDDVLEHVDKVESRVNIVEGKVDDLNKIVLPLTVAMNQTAENTKKISETLEVFTKSQSETNGKFYDKFHAQDLEIQGVKNLASGLSEKKKYNATVTVAILGIVSAFITGMFTLAPLMFP